MPFLRRKGNMTSENDIRRHTLFAPSTSTSSNDAPPPPLPVQPVQPVNAEQTDDDDNGQPISSERTHESTISTSNTRINSRPASRPASRSDTRPDTPPTQEENSRHRRFSVLRFRNASDSQLSIRAKQHAEKPPPIPRRT